MLESISSYLKPLRSNLGLEANKVYGKDYQLELVPVRSNSSSGTIGIFDRKFIANLVTAVVGAGASTFFLYFFFKFFSKILDPTSKAKDDARKKAEELIRKIGVRNVQLSEYELCVAADLICPLDIPVSWSSIGGLQKTIKEIQENVILPFSRSDLFMDSSLLSAPKGVLLYGPPGCGKTMIAKATAKASGVRFINLQVSSMMDKWYGESQKRVAAIYTLAMKIQPVIIFIDEIDAFLRSRSSTDHEVTAVMKTQFMTFWDGLITDPTCQVLIMGATNRPEDVDAAILRRMPTKFHIGLPHCAQREDILRVILEEEPVSASVDLAALARMTSGFSGSDLKELSRAAAIGRVRDYLDAHPNMAQEMPGQVQLRHMEMKDFKEALKKMKRSNANQIRDNTNSSRNGSANPDYSSPEYLMQIIGALVQNMRRPPNNAEAEQEPEIDEDSEAEIDDVIDDIPPE